MFIQKEKGGKRVLEENANNVESAKYQGRDTYYFDDFDGEDPYGKGEIYIRNQETCYHTPQTILYLQ